MKWGAAEIMSACLTRTRGRPRRAAERYRAVVLERPISEWPGMRPAGDGEVTQAYLALRFRGAERTFSFRLMNNNPVLSRPCTILLEDAGTYFFPVYDFFFKEPFVFQGIEISLADRSLLEGMYVFEGAEALPLWPYVFVPEEGKPFEGYKTGRLDRDLLGLSAEIRSAFGFWPEEGVAAYLPLIRRFPFHEPYVERALAHAARCRDESFRLALWEVLGKYVPERRLEAGRFFASRADEALAAERSGKRVTASGPPPVFFRGHAIPDPHRGTLRSVERRGWGNGSLRNGVEIPAGRSRRCRAPAGLLCAVGQNGGGAPFLAGNRGDLARG